MAQEVAVVRATLTATGSGTTDFTSSGFGTPAAAIVIVGNASSGSNPATSVIASIGFWDGTNQICESVTSEDAVASSDTYRLQRTDYIAAGVDPNSTTVIAFAYAASAITDGIRLTMSVDNTTEQRYATVLLLKGVSAKALLFTPNSTVNATSESASLGFAPKLLFSATTGNSGTTPNDGSAQAAAAPFGLGVADENGTHRSLGWGLYDAGSAARIDQNISETYLAGQIYNNAVSWELEITTWGSDTFTATTRTGGSGSDQIAILALGGADLSYQIGTITTRTTTGTTEVSTTWAPDALLVAAGTSIAVDTLYSNNYADGTSIGLSDGTNDYVHYWYDEDAADTMNNGSLASASEVLHLVAGDAASGYTDLVAATVSFGATSFTLDYTTVDATSRYGWYIAFGASGGLLDEQHTGSGGVAVGGAATPSKDKAFDTTGGAAIGGAAAMLRGKVFVPTGGAAAGGGANTALRLFADFDWLLPDADVTAGAWSASTPPDLYAMLDEATPSDADYVFTDTASSEMEVSLSSVVDPGVDTGHGFRVRASGAGTTLTVKLVCNTTVIATRTTPLGASLATFDFDLTEGEAAAITDYADLRIRASVA